MAYISNQWLKRPSQRRSYDPVPVVIDNRPQLTPWERKSGIKIKLETSRKNGDHKYVLFTEQEVRDLLPKMILQAGRGVQRNIVTRFLLDLDVERFGSLVSEIIAKREKRATS